MGYHAMNSRVSFAAVCVILLVCSVCAAEGSCKFFDAHWLVKYVGLKKFDPANIPEPPRVEQLGRCAPPAPCHVLVTWGHIILDRDCVDRYIVHIWDVPDRHNQFTVSNNSVTSFRIQVPPCTLFYVQVELQEDDDPARPDSRKTFTTTTAITTDWRVKREKRRCVTLSQSGTQYCTEVTQPIRPKLTVDCSWRGPLYCTVHNKVRINESYSDWDKVSYDADYLRGVRLDWRGLVRNPTCVKAVRILATRLVLGAISDHVKTVRKPITNASENAFVNKATLALPCNDRLPYTLTVELIQGVNVNGSVSWYAARSSPLDHLLICTWSEVSNDHLYPVAGQIFKPPESGKESKAFCGGVAGDCQALEPLDKVLPQLDIDGDDGEPAKQLGFYETPLQNSGFLLYPWYSGILVMFYAMCNSSYSRVLNK